MKDGAQQDENVPYDVVIGNLFIDVKEGSDCVNNSSRYE